MPEGVRLCMEKLLWIIGCLLVMVTNGTVYNCICIAISKYSSCKSACSLNYNVLAFVGQKIHWILLGDQLLRNALCRDGDSGVTRTLYFRHGVFHHQVLVAILHTPFFILPCMHFPHLVKCGENWPQRRVLQCYFNNGCSCDMLYHWENLPKCPSSTMAFAPNGQCLFIKSHKRRTVAHRAWAGIMLALSKMIRCKPFNMAAWWYISHACVQDWRTGNLNRLWRVLPAKNMYCNASPSGSFHL